MCVWSYLVGSLQRGASVHVVFGFEDVHHLIRVEFEHALHLHAVCVLFSASVLHLLLQRVMVTLTLTDPPQVPTQTEEDDDDKPTVFTAVNLSVGCTQSECWDSIIGWEVQGSQTQRTLAETQAFETDDPSGLEMRNQPTDTAQRNPTSTTCDHQNRENTSIFYCFMKT